MISTRGRYAVRILLDLASDGGGDRYIPIKEVAKRQGISLKYIERIMPPLKDGGLVEGVPGLRGGYKLMKKPEEISVWEILSLAEGNLAPVACLEANAAACARSPECRTLPMWENYYKITKDYFSSITLADLADKNGENIRKV